MLPALPSTLLASTSLVSFPLCLLNLSPVFTSSLPPLPLHFLIPQANSAPKDVTCHVILVKSLHHIHCTVIINKMVTLPPTPQKYLKKGMQQFQIAHH